MPRLIHLERARLRFASLIIPIVLLTACSSFHRDWKSAGVRYPVPRPDILGQWQGTWQSDVSGHHDKLRCVITEADNHGCRARFRAKYHTIFSFAYTVPLQAQVTNGVWTFAGEADLGKLAGGEYHYQGQATPTHFSSTYRSKADHGTFEMSRPWLE